MDLRIGSGGVSYNKNIERHYLDQPNPERTKIMKKLLIALAAVSAIGAGATAAQAKVHFNLYVDAPSYYEPVGYYTYDCHWVKVKVVKYDYYHNPIVTWKKKKVCEKVYHQGYQNSY
jgi:hypothetical protein